MIFESWSLVEDGLVWLKTVANGTKMVENKRKLLVE